MLLNKTFPSFLPIVPASVIATVKAEGCENKCCPVCGMVHIKDPLLLIGMNKGRKEIFHLMIHSYILFTVIWCWTYGKGPLR